MFYGETDGVFDYVPDNNGNHPPSVFYRETNVVLYCSCWYKVSGVQTQLIVSDPQVTL